VRREFFCAALIVAAALAGGCGGTTDGAGTATSTTARETPPSGTKSIRPEPRGSRPVFAGKPSPTFPRLLHVCLDGSLSPANAAVAMAERKGFFADVGLSVRAFGGVPVLPRRPVRYIAAYTDDVALTQQPQVALAKQHGAPIVAVGSLVSQPTAAMIWLKRSGIRGIADLRGKTIAVPGIPYQEAMLESILEKAGVNPAEVEVKRVDYRLVPVLLAGKADAIFGGSWNIEGVALRERGLKPVIKRVQELGVPSYDELVVITRSDWAAREPWVVRKFMSALARGVRAVRRNPAAALQLVEQGGSHYRGVSTRQARAEVRATLPLLSRTGEFDSGRAGELLAWMQGEGMIRRQPSVSRLFTERYLPQGG
jgi:putative hydroxymethylpyrimidine transport system substrate-binding protein